LYILNVEVNKNMEEIITLDGKQFKLTTDRPLTALERQQTIAQIRAQTGCSSCHQPRTLDAGAGFGDIYGLEDVGTCVGTTKASGEVITLSASPNGAIGPYHVRFWRKPAEGAINALTYSEIGSARTVNEGGSTSTSFTLYDTDLVAASGHTTAGIPVTDTSGALTDPGGSTKNLPAGYIRLATTVYDSCPTGSKACVSSCDVTLGCIAPTCNFTVT
jgi:hypothetical protein